MVNYCLSFVCGVESRSGEECRAGGEVFGDASIVGCFGDASVFLLTDQNNVNCGAIRSPMDCNDDSTCSWCDLVSLYSRISDLCFQV